LTRSPGGKNRWAPYLVDSGVWIGAFNPRDRYHEEAKLIIRGIADRAIQSVIITDHILGEVTTYIRKKVGSEASVRAAEAMLDTNLLEIIFSDEDDFNAAYHIFKRYEGLSHADALSVVFARNLQSPGIFSFDAGFDGIRGITRLEKIPNP